MSKQKTLKFFLAASLTTIAIAIAVLLIALFASTSGSIANGIGAYAGGISQRFVSVLVLALPAVFVIVFFIFRSALK